MGAISPNNDVKFKSADNLYGKIKRTLRTFKNNSLIDEGEFPQLTKEVLSQLGLSACKEATAIIGIKDFKGVLPEDFSQIYSAYRYESGEGFIHNQNYFQGGWVFYRDITNETILKSGNCELHQEGHCDGDGVFEKLTVREYIGQKEFGNGDGFTDFNFRSPTLMTLNPNVKKNKCEDGNTGRQLHNQYMIDEGWAYTNFESGCIYIKYYSFPIDFETGTPMIPDIESVERAIQYYILWQLFLGWYWNDEVPNVMQKAREAERMYNEHFAQALHESKLPHFQTLIDAARIQRNRFAAYRSLDQFGSWQRN